MGWHRFVAAAYRVVVVIMLIFFFAVMIYGIVAGEPALP